MSCDSRGVRKQVEQEGTRRRATELEGSGADAGPAGPKTTGVRRRAIGDGGVGNRAGVSESGQVHNGAIRGNSEGRVQDGGGFAQVVKVVKRVKR